MDIPKTDYRLFFDFIREFLPSGFHNIDLNSPLMLKLDRMLETNNQFFLIGNLIHMQVMYTSSKSRDLIGIEPTKVDPTSFLSTVHPNDLSRLVLARSKLMNLGGELFIAKKGIKVISTTLQFQKSLGIFIEQLVQCFLFYQNEPLPTVYMLQVNTDISWFHPFKYGYHYYVGDDLSYFRYPDEKLLLQGNAFSRREYEIIKLVSDGLNSDQIANKLFLSVHTVETHRRNILKKSGKSSLFELVMSFKKQGII